MCIKVPSYGLECYPSDCYAKLNSNYLHNASRCWGREDIAICSFVNSTNIKSIVQSNVISKVTTRQSPHPSPKDFNLLNQQIFIEGAKSYEISFFHLTQFRFSGLYICLQIPCGVGFNYVTYFRPGSSNIPGIKGTNPLIIKAHQFYYSFLRLTTASFYNTLEWGFQMTIIAKIPLQGWNCINRPRMIDPIYNSLIKSNPSYKLYALNLCEDSSSYSWSGVTCIQGKVRQIALDSYGLRGVLKREFFAFEQLQVLSLKDNHLSGSLNLPVNWNSTILDMDLSGNSFQGIISTVLRTIIIHAPYLIYLTLNANNFNGSLPDIPSNNISTLDVSFNDIVGQVPSSWCGSNIPDLFFLPNSGIRCYESCLTVDNQTRPIPSSYGSLPVCSPTISPTESPVSPVVILSTQNIGIIIICAVVVLISICIVYYIFHKQSVNYAKINIDDDESNAERLFRLSQLPLHSLFIDSQGKLDIATSTETILKYSDTICEVDYDGNSLIDLAIRLNIPDPLIELIVRESLPVMIDQSIKQVIQISPEKHRYAWTKIVGPTDRYHEIVGRILQDIDLSIHLAQGILI